LRHNNYHTHTKFCDGKSEPRDYVLKAIEINLKQLGFSAHAPVPFENKWSILASNLEKYKTEIIKLKKEFSKELEILLALEIDYIPVITANFSSYKNFGLDYIIGSIHFVKNEKNQGLWFIDGPEEGYINGIEKIFDNDIQLAVNNYYQQIIDMVHFQKPDIIGHIDKVKMNNKNRFFSEDEKWYQNLVDKTLKEIKESECIIEINTRGIYRKKCDSLFPSISIIEKIHYYNIPVLVSSDAHLPEELINNFEETFDILKQIGIRKTKVFENGKWVDKSF
jgi:histidinol-phosphatase (PHP family)